MNEEELHRFEEILANAGGNMNRLSDWERGFVKDTEERFEKYGQETRVSAKQWAVLERINGKIEG